MGRVDEPWRDAIDVADMTNTDFQNRVAQIGGYSRDGRHVELADDVAHIHDLSRNELLDRATRVYLCHVAVTNDWDIWSEFDVLALVPPRDWDGEFPAVDVSLAQYEDRGSVQFPFSVPPVVDEMVETAVQRGNAGTYTSEIVEADEGMDGNGNGDSDDDTYRETAPFDSKAAFVRRAVEHLAGL